MHNAYQINCSSSIDTFEETTITSSLPSLTKGHTFGIISDFVNQNKKLFHTDHIIVDWAS